MAFFAVVVIALAVFAYNIIDVRARELNLRHFFASHIAERVNLVEKVAVVKNEFCHSVEEANVRWVVQKRSILKIFSILKKKRCDRTS